MENNEFAIKAEALSKCYRLGVKDKVHDNFFKTILEYVKSPLKNYRKYRSLYRFDDLKPGETDAYQNDVIWALNNLSLNVQPGEVVGIIGKNGAGKSTLLKVLSRITHPTAGRVEINGRISSLLEVGTGFHRDLTGRENVYLNGTILGMTKRQLDQRFDQIVDFSGVGKFVDTPVKRYSSGMMVRLAFSVAAHLDPEILIVDEVLAVGDAKFQKKCIDKMQEVGDRGQTVLFVSHNMPAITRLCERAVLIESGQIQLDGPAHEVVRQYLNGDTGTSSHTEWPDPTRAPGGKVARLRSVSVKSDGNQNNEIVDIRKPLAIEMGFDVLEDGHVLLPSFQFFNQDGLEVFVSDDLDPNWRRKPRPKGSYKSRAWIPGNFLAEGSLYVKATLTTVDPYVAQFAANDAVTFQVKDSMEGDTARGDWPFNFGGVVRPLLKWETDFQPNE